VLIGGERTAFQEAGQPISRGGPPTPCTGG
jgi:hypothetical protein